MRRYAVYFLDADETLFDFRRAEREALRKVFGAHGFFFDEGVLNQYRDISESLWRQLERGEVTKEQLQVERFVRLFAERNLRADPADVGAREYPDALSEGNFLLPDALEVCRELSRTSALYLTTNGITRVQKRRLRESEIAPYISGIFVSEEAGAAKPQKAYFDYVFAKTGWPDRSRVLIVGDSLTSDIAGGANAGVDSCWLNPEGKPLTGNAVPTWEIASLRELLGENPYQFLQNS